MDGFTFDWTCQVRLPDVIILDEKRAIFIILTDSFGQDGDVSLHHLHRTAMFDVHPEKQTIRTDKNEPGALERWKWALETSLPAEYSTESSVFLRVEVFCCDSDWKMGDLQAEDKTSAQMYNLY